MTSSLLHPGGGSPLPSPTFDDDALRDLYRKYRETEDEGDEDAEADLMEVQVISPTAIDDAKKRRKRRATSIAGLPSHRPISTKDDQVLLRDVARDARAKARRKSEADLRSPKDLMSISVAGLDSPAPVANSPVHHDLLLDDDGAEFL